MSRSQTMPSRRRGAIAGLPVPAQEPDPPAPQPDPEPDRKPEPQPEPEAAPAAAEPAKARAKRPAGIDFGATQQRNFRCPVDLYDSLTDAVNQVRVAEPELRDATMTDAILAALIDARDPERLARLIKAKRRLQARSS